MINTGKQETGKSAARLRLAVIITGLAGLAGMTAWGLYNYEGGPSWLALLPVMIVCVLPFAAGIILGWSREFWGGIYLIAMALIWSAVIIGTHLTHITSQPMMEQLAYPLLMVAACYLPQMAAGVLFIFAWAVRRNNAIN